MILKRVFPVDYMLTLVVGSISVSPCNKPSPEPLLIEIIDYSVIGVRSWVKLVHTVWIWHGKTPIPMSKVGSNFMTQTWVRWVPRSSSVSITLIIAWWRHKLAWVFVNIGLGNYLIFDVTQTLLRMVLSYCLLQSDTKEYISMKCAWNAFEIVACEVATISMG